VLVESGNIIVFVVAVSKDRILTVSPVVDLIFLVEDYTEISSSSDSLDILAFKRLHLCGLRYDLGNVSAMSSRTNRVYEQFQEQADVLAPVSEGIDLAFVGKDDGVALSCDCVLDFDVMLLEIVDDFSLALVLCVSVTELSVSTAAQRVQVSYLCEGYPDSPMATMWFGPTDVFVTSSGSFRHLGCSLPSHTKRRPALKSLDATLINYKQNYKLIPIYHSDSFFSQGSYFLGRVSIHDSFLFINCLPYLHKSCSDHRPFSKDVTFKYLFIEKVLIILLMMEVFKEVSNFSRGLHSYQEVSY
jgi:hypothetical protein